jgi:hypothetical protein
LLVGLVPAVTFRHAPQNALRPAPADAVADLVVTRDKHRFAVGSREIAPCADLRAILQAARSDRIAAGWICTDIGPVTGFFFTDKDGERLQVAIEQYDPDGPGAPLHCDPKPK